MSMQRCGSDCAAALPALFRACHVGRFYIAHGLASSTPALCATTGSDEPNFVKGISAQLKQMHHGPLSKIMSFATRAKLAAALALGIGPAGLRTDPGESPSNAAGAASRPHAGPVYRGF